MIVIKELGEFGALRRVPMEDTISIIEKVFKRLPSRIKKLYGKVTFRKPGMPFFALEETLRKRMRIIGGRKAVRKRNCIIKRARCMKKAMRINAEYMERTGLYHPAYEILKEKCRVAYRKCIAA